MHPSKRSAFALAAVVALVGATTPAAALTVYLEYDSAYDMSKIKTYAWITPKGAEINPIVNQRIVNAINYQLGNRGKLLVDGSANPDVYVTYHANAREEFALNSTDIVPPGWGWHSNYGTAMTGEKTYRTGTLIVDCTDAKTGKLVWRGTAEDSVKQEPDKIERTVTKALEKMAKEWDKLVKSR